MAAGHARFVEPLSEQGAGAALRPLIAVERVELGRLEGALPDGLELVEALSWPKASMDPACRRAARTCSCTSRSACLGYPNSGPVCGERALKTTQKLSERTNWARIISICPLHNIGGV